MTTLPETVTDVPIARIEFSLHSRCCELRVSFQRELTQTAEEDPLDLTEVGELYAYFTNELGFTYGDDWEVLYGPEMAIAGFIQRMDAPHYVEDWVSAWEKQQ